MKFRGFLLLAVLFCAAFSVFGQENAVELLGQNRYPITLSEGKLAGAGAEFLMKETKNAQFVVLGEQHNNREIPRFTSALFAALKKQHGFKYLALEQDPLTMRLISGSDLAGNRQKILALAKGNPNAFTFITDQELEMIAEAGRISDASTGRVWGLDQVFGPVHGLEALIPFLGNEAVRSSVRGMIEKLKALESERSAKRDRFTVAEAIQVEGFLELLKRLGGQKDPEAAFIVSQMLVSARIYGNNIAAGKGELTGFDSNVEREENMKRLLMSEYRHAQESGEKVPRALLKFGHYHSIRGRGWSNVHTLGNFVSEFARSNGMDTFHIAIYINNSEGDYSVLSSYPDYKPFADASPADGWSVIDLRPLRKYIHGGKLEGGNPELTRLAFGFDAVLVIGGGKPGTYDLFPE